MYNYVDNFWAALTSAGATSPYTGNFPAASTYTPDGHTYQARLGCWSGSGSLYNSPVIYMTPASSLPSAPAGLNIASPTQAPVLNWAAVSGAVSYNVYRDDTKISSVTTNSYTDNSALVGDYTYYVTAANGSGESEPSNSVDATVVTHPAITSPASTSTGMRAQFGFHITTTGSPAPSITESGALPAGVTLTDNGDGTADLAGIVAAGTAGTYPITISASNGVGSNATQSFALTVTSDTSAPAIISASTDTESFGVPFSFTVDTTGYPAPKLTKTGALPSGVTFTNNGDGTATIAGTPGASAAGVYTLALRAKSTAGTATQNLSLTITKAPVINNIPNKTSSVGVAFSMAITTKGFTDPALTESGALPSGLTFADHGDGTASLAGTPAIGTGGSYSITVTATNPLGTTSQTFTLKVNEAPIITSVATASATVGSLFSFQATATGFPAPSITKSGVLPRGVTFHGSTGTFSGAPKAGSAGSYPITITAKNSSGTVTQSFVLVVS